MIDTLTRATTSTAGLPADYADRVYAGVLGKLVGVYLGRPIEGWSAERIAREVGEVDHYLPGNQGAPLIVPDDDITGTFTFIRALEDSGYPASVTPQQVAESWLNYNIERRTIFWWGGVGNSTEHTAYIRLKQGIPAPESGSRARNGTTISEQIGSQIFIDSWALVVPGDPARAAELARSAASVSHDGEAIYGAQVIAAMEAQAFVESDLGVLLDTAVALIPADSVIARLIGDLRAWRLETDDWREALRRVQATYGYDRYGGNCHMVPNHALIIMALLYGDDDLGRSLMIVNTAGWDTDCNSGNVGCLLGIKNGLAAFDGGYDWRGPVADRMYLSTADGGRAITDAASETIRLVNAGRALAGEEPIAPKGGVKLPFSLPGAVHGLRVEEPASAALRSVPAGDETGDHRLLVTLAAATARLSLPTFIPVEAQVISGSYELIASPTIHAGQLLRARLLAPAGNAGLVGCRLSLRHYDGEDNVVELLGETVEMDGGAVDVLAWTIPDTGGCPILDLGVIIEGAAGNAVAIDWIDWSGAPTVTLGRPGKGTMWRRAWVDAVDQFEGRWKEPYRIVSNEGTGLLSQGGRDWVDYGAEVEMVVPLAAAAGLAVRVQGVRRYYALVLGDDGTARIVKALGEVQTLAECPLPLELDRSYRLRVEVSGGELSAWVDGELVLTAHDDDPLPGGAVGILVRDGTVAAQAVSISPV